MTVYHFQTCLVIGKLDELLVNETPGYFTRLDGSYMLLEIILLVNGLRVPFMKFSVSSFTYGYTSNYGRNQGWSAIADDDVQNHEAELSNSTVLLKLSWADSITTSAMSSHPYVTIAETVWIVVEHDPILFSRTGITKLTPLRMFA